MMPAGPSDIDVIGQMSDWQLNQWRLACARRDAAEICPRDLTFEKAADVFYEYLRTYDEILNAHDLRPQERVVYHLDPTNGSIQAWHLDD